ncbi:MAG TPA: glycoside hydrolase family 38 C-terminal domain-containing protein [Dehalococcoidia bacterium]|nr:glycoside hydrolase family 38 C-terminal domain-containing protein [Dehalococcoidia bacterium]
MTSHTSRTFVVVSHTHWDREWYLPFEAFRARLVRMMDALLDLLDRDPEYRHFVLDGHTIPLDDYLEIRPERRADIERLVKAGRLLIGPGYVLPDEFLIGGESHIRNLQLGIRSAEAYGGAMMVGYSPDAFGHIAHLPAILRGFGIDTVAIWRGVGREATTSEFRWASPDGSEVLALHFPYGYGMLSRLPTERDDLANALQNLRTMLEPFASTRYVLVPNGTDHLPAHEGLSQVIRTANELLEDAEMVHGSYPMLAEAVRRELGDRIDTLPRLEGEFRSSARSHVLAGVLSARMWLKQRYQECEDLLARYAEPLAAWADLLRSANGTGGQQSAEDRGLLRHAWRLLLQNAPHDSVTGCHVDAVADDMRVRFDRCQQIAGEVLYSAQRYIADQAALDGGSVAVFNSEGGPRTDFCTIRLPLDGGRPPAKLTDADGSETPLQLLERGLRSPLDAGERAVFGFVAGRVPAYGYRAYRVGYGGTRTRKHATGNSEEQIENELFRVSADPADGTLTVEDRRSGVTLRGLNRFVDGGDRGDEYNYCPPANDELIDPPARPPRVRVTERGPARWTLEVTQTYSLPEELTADRDSRSARRAGCRITSRVRLYPGVPRVDIETEVDNQGRDHRLRAHFPTSVRSDWSQAEQHFGVVRRPVALPEADGTWMETPTGTYPHKSFVDVSDGTQGLVVANRGLPEYEALPEGDGTVTIALTLLRCVGWLSRGDFGTRRGPAAPSLEAPGAQMPGRWTFHYSLIPHAGTWDAAYRQAHAFARPLRAVRGRGGSGSLPASASLLQIEPDSLVLSALKTADSGDGIVARVYNTADEAVSGSLRLLAPHSGAETVDLDEDPLGPAETDGDRVLLSVRPNQILSVKFRTTQE